MRSSDANKGRGGACQRNRWWWHRDYQRDIVRQAKDVVIDAQAFILNPLINEDAPYNNSIAKHLPVVNRARLVELLARLDAYEVRVEDEQLAEWLRQLHIDLEQVRTKGSVSDERLSSAIAYIRKFNARVAELEGNTRQGANEGGIAALVVIKAVQSDKGPQAITEHTGQQAGVPSESEE